MKPNLKNITKKHFDNLNVLSIINKYQQHNYYSIEYDNIEIIKFSSMSEVLPELFIIDENTLLVGIDLFLIIYDLKNKKIILNIELETYYFFSFKTNSNLISVNQNEIIFFNLNNYLQKKHEYLHDIYVSHTVGNNQLIITSLENVVFKIDIPSWDKVH